LTHHLTILIGDTAFGETFTKWADADLMDAVGFVDLGNVDEELDAPVLWTRSGNTSLTILEEVGTSERWDPVTFVSVRSDSLSSYGTGRFKAERVLLDTVRSLFLKNIEFQAFTVGIADPGGSYGAELFDPNWQLHLLHDPMLIADADAAVLPIRPKDRSTTCLLTALLAAGGFRWQEEPVLDLSDHPTGHVIPGRICRSQLRLVNAGRFIDEVLAGAFPDSGPWTVPPNIQAIGASSGSHPDREVARRVASAANLSFRPFQPPQAEAPDQISLLKGLRLFIQKFLEAARKTPLILIERAKVKIGEGIASAAQQLTYGDQASLIMKFRPGLTRDQIDNVLTRLQKVGMPDTGTSVTPDPRPWTILHKASFGLVDGGELPDDLPPPKIDTHRLLYLEPAAIGPAPDDDGFSLSPLEVGLLELDIGFQNIGPMDVDDARALSSALREISGSNETDNDASVVPKEPGRLAKDSKIEEDEDGPDTHRPSHPKYDPSSYQPVAAFYQGPSAEIPDNYKTHQVIHQEALREHEPIDGPWHTDGRCDHCGTPSFHHGVCYLHEPSGRLIHVGHICAKKSGLPLPDKNPAEAILQSLQDRWQQWLVDREKCLLWRVGVHLAEATDKARHELATGMAEQERPDLATEEVDKARAKLRLGTIRSGLVALLTGLTTVASLIITFIPFLWVLVAFVAAIGSTIAVGTRFTRELVRAQYRQDAGYRTRRNAPLKIHHSSKEFARLVNARQQFQDWQAVIRTVVHRPYGQLDSSGDRESVADTFPRPQSFVYATANPTRQQLKNAQKHSKGQTFNRGWLTTAFLEMKQQWETDYATDVVLAGEQTPQPESDNSPPGSVKAHIPGTNEPVYAEREDFRIRMTSGQLHGAAMATQIAAIVKWLSDQSLNDLLSPVSVDGPGKALNKLPPETFLSGLEEPLDEVPPFKPEVYSADPDALHLKLANLDSSHPTGADAASLIPSTVSPGRDLIFASFRLLLSAPTNPEWLAGYDTRQSYTAPSGTGKTRRDCRHCGKHLTGQDGVLVDPDDNPDCANNPDGDHHQPAENGPQSVV
jgi:hypothetical protein